MPNRDYAVRSKKKNNGNKFLIFIIIILLIILSGLGLLFLAKNSDSPAQVVTSVAQPSQPKITLPSRPEEVYSYIRDLETREVPIDQNAKLAQIAKEQDLKIAQQKEAEKRKLEQQVQLQQNTEHKSTEHSLESTETAPENSQEALTKKAEEQRLAEEQKKQQERARKTEQLKQDKAKVESSKDVVKPVDLPKPKGKFGLQCGAFKSKAQAENMQARLAMAGYNARISSSSDWNRVFVGPIGDRAAASAAQSNARSVAECLVIGM
ncbi:cell division protein FtsN [Ursidibacter arcticus]